MGPERVALWRSPRYWVIFAGVIIGAAVIAYAIAVWVSGSDSAVPVEQDGGTGAGGSRDSQRPLPGPTVHDTLSKKKELERN